MQDRIQALLFDASMHPKGIDQLLMLSERILTNLVERGSGYQINSYLLFSPLYGDAMMVIQPECEAPEDWTLWADSFSALAQRIEARGSLVHLEIYESQMSVITKERPTQSPDRVRFVVAIAQTHEGEVACVRYDFETARDGKVSIAFPGRRYKHTLIGLQWMDCIFTRTDHSERAKAYAEKMMAAYPPLVVDALVH